MHGVPADLDLQPMVGSMVQRIDLGIHIIRFKLDVHTISVEGDWEIRDSEGELIDQHVDMTERQSFQLHVLLGRTVIGTEVSAPESFALRFDSGHSLRVYDRSDQYESFSIQPGNIFV